MKPVSLAEMEIAKVKILHNARSLVADARLLLRHRRWPRAFTLAHLACEELSKLPMLQRAAMEHAVTGNADWKKVGRRMSSHVEKIEAMVYHEYLLDPDVHDDVDLMRYEEQMRLVGSYNNAKNASLYCCFEDGRCISPREVVTPKLARSIVATSARRLGWFARAERTTRGRIEQMSPDQLREWYRRTMATAE